MSLVLLTTSTISGRVPALLQYQPLLFPDKDQTVVIPTWLHIDLIIPMMSLGFNSMMHMLAATCCKIVRVIGSVCVLSFWLFFLLKPVQFSRIWLNLESTSARVKSYQLAKIVSGGCAPGKKQFWHHNFQEVNHFIVLEPFATAAACLLLLLPPVVLLPPAAPAAPAACAAAAASSCCCCRWCKHCTEKENNRLCHGDSSSLMWLSTTWDVTFLYRSCDIGMLWPFPHGVT